MPQSIPICHNCSKKYTKDGPNIPLLLQCGHTFCEACILRFGRLIKNSGNIYCPECTDHHRIDSVKCIKQMQINSHIYGIITAPNRKTENAVDSMVNDLTNKLSNIAIKQCEEAEEEEEDSSDEEYPNCCECNSRSDIFCKNCDLDYCQNCSDQAHKLVALRYHSPEPVQPKSVFDPCPDHPVAKPTHFLTLTGMPVCPECPSPGNTALILSDVEQMEDLVHEYNVGLEKLLESDQSISELIPVVEDDFLRLKTEVRKEFGYVHGILQAREQHLLNSLEEKQIETVQPLLDLRYEVAKSRKVLRSNFNWVLRNKTRSSRLIRQQAKVWEIKTAIDEGTTVLCVKSLKKPTYVAKKEILKTCIEEFSFLNLGNIHRYVLAGKDNKEYKRYREEEKVVLDLEEDDMLWNDPTASTLEPVLPLQPLEIKPSFAESADLITVTVTYDPHMFYIQRTKDRDTLDELQNILVKYYGLSVTPEDYIKHVSVGDMVCCQFSVDDLWYRARVVTYGNSLAKVLYVDYGNTEEVPIKRLRQLKPQFTHFPALAIQCKLYGIKPRDNEEWTGEATESFKRLTADREFELVTKSKLEDCFEVDLQHTGGDIGSIRELLVFLEHAVFCRSQQSPEALDIELQTVQTEPTHLQWPDSEDGYVEIVVSHIEHPSLFYVQIINKLETLQTIEQEIQKYMENIGHQFPLKSLKKGTICLAKFQDNALYRGMIMGMVQYNVEIFYCDYGNTDYIPRNALFDIPANLAQYHMQALRCELYGVIPPNSEWAEPDKLLFDKLAYTQRNIFTKLEKSADNVHSVSLIDTTQGTEDIDIGAELISKGNARPDPDNVKAEYSEPGHLKLGDIDSTLDVLLCNVESLHCIYVNIPHISYPQFFQELNVTYNSLVKTGNKVIEPTGEWKVGDICVAYLRKLNVYIRAKVVEIDGQNTKVENIDQGKTTDTTLSDLKNLIVDYRHKPKFAVRCHMYGLVPNVGEEWSEEENKVVYKFFNRKIKKERATCYVTVKGDRDPGTKSWPVDMVLCNPQLGYRIRVSEEFVKAGIAKPKRSYIEPLADCYKRLEITADATAKVIVSHVSDDCLIYLQIDPTKETTQALKTALTTAVSQYKPPETEVGWSVGSVCVVHHNNKYYRGLVSNVLGDHLLQVQLVDIGSTIQTPKHSVYPLLVAPETPLLALPSQLTFIEPSWYQGDGSWSKRAAEYLYEKIVNEVCDMCVQNVDTTTKLLSVSLKLKSGEDIAECLVSRGYAVNCGPGLPSLSPVPAPVCAEENKENEKQEEEIIVTKTQIVSYDISDENLRIEIAQEE